MPAGRSSRSSSIARRGGGRTTSGPRSSPTASGIEPHPEWSWWAVRGQLIDSPGYLANYVLAAIAAAALRARIRELRGDWSTGDAGLVRVRVGAAAAVRRVARSPADLIADLLGGPLTASRSSTTCAAPAERPALRPG